MDVLMLIAGTKHCPSETVCRIWGEQSRGKWKDGVGKCVARWHFPSPENPPHCGDDGVMGREERCCVLPGSAGSCLYLSLPSPHCSQMPGPARPCLGPAGPAHDSEIVHYGGTGWGGCTAGVALWHSQSALISFVWQCPADCPCQVSQIWHVSCKFVWAVECHHQKKISYGCLVLHESSCRKRGESHHDQRATFPLSLPLPKLHNCWHHAGRIPFVLSPVLVTQTSLYFVIYSCSCRTWYCHIWGPLWPSE